MVISTRTLSWLLCLLCQLTRGKENGFGEEMAMVRTVSQLSDHKDTDPTLKQCNNIDKDATDEICIDLIFPSELDCNVQCKAFVSGQTTNPNIFEFLGSGARNCTGRQACEYIVQQSDIRADSTYDVFCVIWTQIFHTVPKYHIVPKPLTVSTAAGLDLHITFGFADFVGAAVLLAYISWSMLFVRFKYIRFLHETGFAVVVGLICGAVLKIVWDLETQFNYNMFSYFLLPMVIFAAGFNMRKKQFFRYFGYIATLGITGTVIIFASIYWLSWTATQQFTFYDARGNAVPLQDKSHLLLVMASVLSSTDSVAPIAFLPAASYPLLYSVIFGEGVLNDVVSILLSSATAHASTLPSLGELIGNIAYYFSTSLLMGVLFGACICYLFKRWKPLHEDTVSPIAMLLLLNYACYVVSEICDISSIFALFVCALLCSHYARKHLSVEAQHFGGEVAEFFSYMAEAFVFGYFGLTAVVYLSDGTKFSYSLIFAYSAIVLIARTLAIIILVTGLKCVRCFAPLALGWKEWCMVGFSGCMRGTIAYALIIKSMPVHEAQSPCQTILVSTVLGIVLVNCLVFGGLFPVVLWMLNIEPKCEVDCAPSNLRADNKIFMDKLRTGDDFGKHDLKFEVSGHPVYVTRAHLAVRSEIFKEWFFGELSEHQMVQRVQEAVNEEGINYKTFEKLLEYIYTDSISLEGVTDRSAMASSLLRAADRFQLEGLRRMCKDIAGHGTSIRVEGGDSELVSTTTHSNLIPLDPQPQSLMQRVQGHPTSIRRGVDRVWTRFDRDWLQPVFGRSGAEVIYAYE